MAAIWFTWQMENPGFASFIFAGNNHERHEKHEIEKKLFFVFFVPFVVKSSCCYFCNFRMALSRLANSWSTMPVGTAENARRINPTSTITPVL